MASMIATPTSRASHWSVETVATTEITLFQNSPPPMSLGALWYLVILIAGHAEAPASTLPRFTRCRHDQVVGVVAIHKGGAVPQETSSSSVEHVLRVVIVYVKTCRAFASSTKLRVPQAISASFAPFGLNKFIAYPLLLAGVSDSFRRLQTHLTIEFECLKLHAYCIFTLHCSVFLS